MWFFVFFLFGVFDGVFGGEEGVLGESIRREREGEEARGGRTVSASP